MIGGVVVGSAVSFITGEKEVYELTGVGIIKMNKVEGEDREVGVLFFFFQAEDGIRDAQESRGLGDVYKETDQQGVDGAIFQMISHGFISGALFLCVGVIYDRMHTRDIDAYGGLVNRMPSYALIFLFFTMANVGLPGTSGFVGEFLTLMGIFQVNTWVAMFAASGVILPAAYALWLYRRVVLGDLIKESLKSITDMGRREKMISPLSL